MRFSAFCLVFLALRVIPVSALEIDKDPRPNVLFIAIDDLRPELGCYGNQLIQSPNIDRLAKQGILFNHAYCQQAVCSPSRTSVLTGTRPDTAKVWDLATHFRKALPDVVTLPQHFKAHGYFTQSLGKIYHHGFDDPVSWSVPSVYPKALFGRPNQSTKPNATKAEQRGPAIGIENVPENPLHDGELADMAIAALRDVKKKSAPFFLGVGFIRPHLPFISPKKYWDLYDPAKIPLAGNPFYPKDAPAYAINRGGAELRSYAGMPTSGRVEADYARQLKHGYYAAVSFVDAQVGRVIDELDQLGLRENTIIVLWGDHGWKLGEHDAWAKHSNAEDDTRVPLIISAPGLKQAGKQSAALVELVDIYPTLAELSGLPLPKHLEGRSIKALLDHPELPGKKAAFSQYPRTVGKQKLMGYSMRTERYRFTRWVNEANPAKVTALELYDHQTDPLENTNIAADPANKQLVDELTKQALAGWQAEQQQQVHAVKKVSLNSPDFMDFWQMEFTRKDPLPPTLANVPYGEDKMQVLDFWKAETKNPAPLVFFIHGGAWSSNDKDRVSGLHAYLDAGISVVSINYRFVPAAQKAGIQPPVKWPLHDAARALQFVRSKAGEWNLDKTRIGASGGSAGACSSLWLAFHDDMADPKSSDPIARESTRISCAGVVGAQTTLDPKQMKEWTPNSSYGGHAFGFPNVKGNKTAGFNQFLENREQLLPWINEYSPYGWISKDDPPVYLFYTDPPELGKNQRDTAHTANFGVKVAERFKELGIECHFRYGGAQGLQYADPVKFLIAKLQQAER